MPKAAQILLAATMLIHMYQMLWLNIPQLLPPKDAVPFLLVWCPKVLTAQHKVVCQKILLLLVPKAQVFKGWNSNAGLLLVDK
jgi:hypothetical protein